MTDVPQQNEVSKTIRVNIEDEMRGAYLDYAMSVIIGRALPDVRDGLKPVHRRVLYAMFDLGNVFNKPYKKSARVVGDVIGKYHPHGDVAVYDTIVRMAQDFSLRYPLIDGQGNFGSIDGDAPAAMRYTEVRMKKIANELLADLEKETVDFGSNYDDSLKEPLVLPARFPNLLVNGSSGIAVGMATNIPPHNMMEVIDATIVLIRNPEASINELVELVKGPDFPTGGIIFAGAGLKKAYLTGRGVITIRGKAEIEVAEKGRERIIVTELPYQVNKAKLIEKIADLVRDKKIEGISDLRDESDRTGMRIVVEIKRGDNSTVILNQLYKLTQLQDSFGISLLAIDKHQPKILNLKELLWAFIEHRKEVVLRRTAFELKKAEARAHILLGLKTAVENLDDVVALIKKSKGPDEAREGLIQKYLLSEIQAQAVLDMKLQRLTGLERTKIIEEYGEILKSIEELKKILGSEKLVYEIILSELEEIKANYGDQRRTQISMEMVDNFAVEDLIADEETLVTITHQGYIKRSDIHQFKSQHRGGKGIRGAVAKDDDFVKAMYHTTTLSSLLCFTNKGRVFILRVYSVPEAARTARGKAIVNLLALTQGETVQSILPIREFNEKMAITMITKKGVIKKTMLNEFENIRSGGIIAITIQPGDGLVGAKLVQTGADVFLASKYGKAIRFKEDEARPMGRSARGVNGFTLEEGDEVVSLEVLDGVVENQEILTVTENGYGKRTPVSEYRLTHRGGKGVTTIVCSERNGGVVGVCQVQPKEDVMLVSNQGQMIRIQVDEISEQGRATQGVRLMSIENGEKLVAVEHIVEGHEEQKAH